ncbi:fimbrial-like protein [Citrobacter freundii]|uniref:fimbrial-like protein n=1 Tax=Citrobacter freundii TaxID=546 RepID=UPI00177B4827|nr:fimbrial-like protein [Citrobacter freundii]MBD9990448.1 fimbrial protein [Citrobacter freundii]MBE0052581.1 fimbrial protein [Citrobacter freundii]MDT7291839.1 fimbrial-like protein [Citrobacter freundii]HBU6166526.1 fimbrial protein [Citrobacter freundii]HBV8018229.1 fimbrial protein [Citrobacter freundii]
MTRLRRYTLFALTTGLATALWIPLLHADTNVDFAATVLKDTCQIEVDGNGTVEFSTVGRDYFASGVTAETDYEGGKEFSIKIINCPVSDGAITNLTFDFAPQSGQFATGNNQVFANELTQSAGGVTNVGVVIFTSDSPRTNVLNSDGTSRATFSATTYSDTIWTFYSRMQKVLSGQNITPGELSSRVLVNVRYE